MRGRAGSVPEISVSGLEILPYEHFSPVTGKKAGCILAVQMASSCIACCIFHIISIPFNWYSFHAEAMIGAKVKLLCFAMFALFLKFGARTRPGDIWPFLISETGLKFLIWTKRALSSLVWTQGRIHTGNRVQVIRYPAWQVFEKEGKGSFRRERNARAGAREEGGKETPARRPLFPPSRLLIMYAKITQLWKTGCQISLAAKHLFLAFVLLKQEILSEGTYY